MTAVAPIQQIAPFDVDFDELFRLVSSDIADVRALRNLKPLVPDGAIRVGAEYEGVEESPPRIVVVPTGARYAPARRIGKQVDATGGQYVPSSPNPPGASVRPSTGFGLVNANPAVFWLQWLTFRAQCWGPDSPKGSRGSNLDGFSSALELGRQLLGALARNVGGVPNIQIDGAEFNQPRDVNRFGRLYVLNFAIGTSVTDEPWTISQPVSGTVDISAVNPDGTSTASNVLQFQVP